MKNKILKLVNSLEFQELKSYCGEKTKINALNEYRHNDFIAWWLNPKSGHGLGDAPLKLFLRLAATKSLGEATFGIEGFDGSFYNRVLAGSYNVNLLEDIEVEKNGIDIWTVLELSYEEDGNVVRRIIPVVIENKACSNDLTARYLNAVTSYPGVENVELAPMAILLTEEPTQPQCNQFDNITYHELLTYVVEPLVANDVLQHVADNNREVFIQLLRHYTAHLQSRKSLIRTLKCWRLQMRRSIFSVCYGMQMKQYSKLPYITYTKSARQHLTNSSSLQLKKTAGISYRTTGMQYSQASAFQKQ